MIRKLAYNIEMSFDISDEEKNIAKSAMKKLEVLISKIQISSEHLDIMYLPFKKSPDVPSEALVEKRGLINRFKQAVKKNYFNIKDITMKTIEDLDHFSSGTNAMEVIGTLKNSVGSLEDGVELLLKKLDEFESDDFVSEVIRIIDIIKAKSDELVDIIKDRVMVYLNDDIIINDWTDSFAEELKSKSPMITKLYDERQKALEEVSGKMPTVGDSQQSLNPSDIASVMYVNKLDK